MKLGRKPPSADADLLKAEKELTAANRELAWELSKVAVDVAGFVDPTPISDAVSMGMSLIDGDFVGAGLSLVSMVPYAGDALAKTTKGARAAKKILKLQKKIAALAAKVRALKAAKASKGASKAATRTINKAGKKPPTSGVCAPCAKRARQKTRNSGNSRKLGRALTKHGPRAAKHAAHHIVASSAKRAAPARRVLQRFGIDINSARNGAFLPQGKGGRAPMTHGDLHTNTYYDAVNRALGRARTREQALQILDDIKKRLLNGTFPR